MSNKLGLALLLIVLFAVGCGATALALRSTVDSSAQTLVNHAIEADPMTDVLKVREQAGERGHAWGVVGFVLTILLAVAGLFVYMYLKAKKSREERLLMNAQKRGQRQHPRSRVLPPGETNDLPQLPRSSPVQPVPDWTDGSYE